MVEQIPTLADRIALSAAYAAWAGAATSALASFTALGIALWASRAEELRRRRAAGEREVAFAFGAVGALEMVKPLLRDACNDRAGEVENRRFLAVLDHARMIMDAALTLGVLNMQSLRDAYLIKGLLTGLKSLADVQPGTAVTHARIDDLAAPLLASLAAAEQRLLAHLPESPAVRALGEDVQLDALRRGAA